MDSLEGIDVQVSLKVLISKIIPTLTLTIIELKLTDK